MNDATTSPRTVAAALEDVAKWRTGVVARNRAELGEVDQEIENLRKAVANLQQQIETLRRSREDIAKRDEHLPEEEVEKSYAAVFAALTEQCDALKQRAHQVADLDAAKQRALELSFNDPAIAAVLQEFRQFKTTVEPTLKALPESYRTVMMTHHESVVKRLREHVDAAGAAGVDLKAPPLPVEVVYAVDSPEGTPEVAMLVLPVQEQVQSEWASRGEDAQTWVAARVVQGLYSACGIAGLGAARAAFGGHQGLLAIEIEVAGARNDFGQVLGQEIEKALGGAKELAGAHIEVRVKEVKVDHLLPPEQAESPEMSHA